jgi:hypothetical protein
LCYGDRKGVENPLALEYKGPNTDILACVAAPAGLITFATVLCSGICICE